MDKETEMETRNCFYCNARLVMCLLRDRSRMLPVALSTFVDAGRDEITGEFWFSALHHRNHFRVCDAAPTQSPR